MKIKWKLPKKALYAILAALVALALIIVVVIACVRAANTTTTDPHAGHDHATGETHAPESNKVKIDEAYVITENENGTYSIVVKNHMGGVMFNKENLAVKPTVTVIDDALLSIYGMDGKNNNLSGWVVFCNIQNIGVSKRFERALATKGDRVACLEQASGKWFVFVSDLYGGSQYYEGTELPDLAIQPSGGPELEYSTAKDGNLKVTYATKTGKKTVTVKWDK